MSFKTKPIFSIPYIATLLTLKGENVRMIGLMIFRLITFRLTIIFLDDVGITFAIKIWKFEISLGLNHSKEK